MAGLSHKPQRRETDKRQNRSDYKTGSTKERKRAKIISELNSTSLQVHKQPIKEDRQNEKTFEGRNKMGMDDRNKQRFLESEERNYRGTVSGKL